MTHLILVVVMVCDEVARVGLSSGGKDGVGKTELSERRCPGSFLHSCISIPPELHSCLKLGGRRRLFKASGGILFVQPNPAPAPLVRFFPLPSLQPRAVILSDHQQAEWAQLEPHPPPQHLHLLGTKQWDPARWERVWMGDGGYSFFLSHFCSADWGLLRVDQFCWVLLLQKCCT